MDSTIVSGIRMQWNFANSLTAFRAFSVLPALPLIYFDFTVSLFWLVVLAALSDAEGYWARWTKTTTHLGRVFDPIADKLFTSLLLVVAAVTMESYLVLILAVLTLGYDIDNTWRRLQGIIDACCNRRSMNDGLPVTFLSKGKTAFLYIVVIALYTPQSWSMYNQTFVDGAVFTAIVYVGVSWANNRQLKLRALLAMR